ncbi:hypothetical protein [Aureliella helgolandensis]|nr:hypothetical protein [Aureliella helgolandensis]
MAHSETALLQATDSAGRRIAVRWFVGVCALWIAIETLPTSVPGIQRLKDLLSPISNRCGVWQGEWPLFAPNPVLNNAWLTAEITAPDGTKEYWNSTYWATASSWEKFIHFRHVNYGNRIASAGRAAVDDFCDYIARQEISSSATPESNELNARDAESAGTAMAGWTVTLFRDQMTMPPLLESELPPREEIAWISVSRPLTSRRYSP